MAAAESLDGSVALKALGISHKTEHGAVRLDIRDSHEVRETAEALLTLARDSQASARLLVERFEAGTIAELLVGISRDPAFGPMLTIGSGGTLVELLADSVTLLLPVTAEEVRDALSTLRGMPILEGYRGGPPADVDAAVDAILAIAQYGADNAERLEELDVNPLGIRPRGEGAVALDALIRIRETRAASPTGETEP